MVLVAGEGQLCAIVVVLTHHRIIGAKLHIILRIERAARAFFNKNLTLSTDFNHFVEQWGGESAGSPLRASLDATLPHDGGSEMATFL